MAKTLPPDDLFEGVTLQAQRHPDPPLHLLDMGLDFVGTTTWCTGAAAFTTNTVRRRRCHACTKKLREAVEKGTFTHATLERWLASTTARGRSLTARLPK